MAENSYVFVAPVPVYSSNHELLARLTKELQDEREKTFNLAKDLAVEKHKNQQLECYFLSISGREKNEAENKEEKKLPKIESSETMGSFSDLKDIETFIGAYNRQVRNEKIKKYKEKIKKYRQKVHVSRVFSGRSVIAKIKPRINGKFVKSVPEESEQKE